MDLEDAADNFTARKHVEIVLVPVAGRATCRSVEGERGASAKRQAPSAKARGSESERPKKKKSR
jgi:hypothetical protein